MGRKQVDTGMTADEREDAFRDEIDDFAEENAKLRAEAAALRERVKALEDVISEAAPLAWVAHQDMDGASAWEKRAHALINPGADDKRASTREP